MYLANWIAVIKGAWPSNVVGHFWSLAVEEQFYLVWPFVIARLSLRSIKRLAVTLGVLELVLRVLLLKMHVPIAAVAYSTLTHSDALLFGAFCAAVYLERRSAAGLHLGIWAAVPIVIFEIFVIALPSEASRLRFYLSAGFTLIGLSASAIVLWLALKDGAETRWQTILSHPALRKVGRYSYGMYVYHVPLLMLAEFLVFQRVAPSIAADPLFATFYVIMLGVITFFVAMISFEYFERPILHLKTRFSPRFDAQHEKVS